MKRRTKKLLYLLLASIMVSGLLPGVSLQAYAEGDLPVPLEQDGEPAMIPVREGEADNPESSENNGSDAGVGADTDAENNPVPAGQNNLSGSADSAEPAADPNADPAEPADDPNADPAEPADDPNADPAEPAADPNADPEEDSIQVFGEGPYVCKVGEEYYEDFKEAVDAAVSGDTILLVTDVVLQSAGLGGTGLLIDGKNITIDADAWSLKLYSDESDYAVHVKNGGSLTIHSGLSWGSEDMQVELYGTFAGVYTESGGHFELNKGSIRGGNYGVFADGTGSSVLINGGTVGNGNIDGDPLDPEDGLTVGQGAFADNNAQITLSCGVFGRVFGIAADHAGKVTLTGEISGSDLGIHAENGGIADVTGSVSAWESGIYAVSGGKVTVTGSISGNTNGIYAAGENTTVTVTGDATALFEQGAATIDDDEGNGVYAEDSAYVTVSGDAKSENNVGVRAVRNAQVDIGGDVWGYHAGTMADGHAGVLIHGSSIAENCEETGSGFGVNASGGAQVGVEGDAIGTFAGAYVWEQLDLENYLRPLQEYTYIRIEGSAKATDPGGTGVINGGGLVVVGWDITGDNYITIGEQELLGSPAAPEQLRQSDAKEKPDEITDNDFNDYKGWYYHEFDVSPTVKGYHSFTLVKGDAIAHIGDTLYYDLAEAFEAVQNGETITILRDHTHRDPIEFTRNKIFTLDLNGHKLNISSTEPGKPGFLITNRSELTLTGDGEFNVTGVTAGVEVQTGARTTVTNVQATGGYGAFIGSNGGGGFLTVLKDAVGSRSGARADSYGVITIGSADYPGNAVGETLAGAWAENGGMIVVYGNASGVEYGAYADGKDSSVSVGRNAIASGTGSTGAQAGNQGGVTVVNDAIGGKYGVVTEETLNEDGFTRSLEEFTHVQAGGFVRARDADGTGVFNSGGIVYIETGIEAANYITAGAQAEMGPGNAIAYTAAESKEWPEESIVNEYPGQFENYAWYYYDFQLDENIDKETGEVIDPSVVWNVRHSYTLVFSAEAVAEIDGKKFADFEKAIAYLDREQEKTQKKNEGKPDRDKQYTVKTIKLLKDCWYSGGIILKDAKLTIDTNGHTLETGYAISGFSLNNSTVETKGTGAVRAVGIETGVQLFNGSKATLTSAVSEGMHGAGAYVSGGSTLTLTEDAVGYLYGIEVLGKGSTATVRNALAADNLLSGIGAYVGDEAALTVKGNAEGGKYGALVEAVLNSETGVVIPGGKLTVEGNAIGGEAGAAAFGEGSNLTVKGKAEGTGILGIGAYAKDTGKVTVTGESRGGDLGAAAQTGGKVTVNSNAIGGSGGAFAEDKKSSVTVNGFATGTDGGSFGAKAENAGGVKVNLGVQGDLYGAVADGVIFEYGSMSGSRSSVKITNGNATATSQAGIGAYATNGGTVSVASTEESDETKVVGNAEGVAWGAFAQGIGSKISISGSAKSTEGMGADARNGGTIEITLDVTGYTTGAYAEGAGSKITLGANVTAMHPDSGIGIDVRSGALITEARDKKAAARGAAEGEITASYIGITASGGGTAIVDGIIISGDCYVVADDLVRERSQVTVPTTKTGYLTYHRENDENGAYGSTVFVRDEDAPQIEIDSFTLDKTNLPFEGGKVTTTIRGKNLLATEADLTIAYPSGEGMVRVGEKIAWTDTLVVMTFLIEANTSHYEYPYVFSLLVNGGNAGFSAELLQAATNFNAPTFDTIELTGLTQYSTFSWGIPVDEEELRPSDFTWRAFGLPSGVDINPNNGTLYGKPLVFGEFIVNLQLTDIYDEIYEVTLYMSIAEYNMYVSISGANIPQAKEGDAYLGTIISESGTEPYTWKAAGLPPGLELTVAETTSIAYISGTPTKAGNYTVVITGTDADGHWVKTIFDISVAAATPSQSDMGAVIQDAAVLTWDVIKGENETQENVNKPLFLPAIGAGGTTITWHSDSPVIGSDGIVMPLNGRDPHVVLTAVVSRGNASETAVFVLTVEDHFIPVTGITGLTLWAETGTALNLTGTVQPTNATNQNITWSIKSAGDTGAVISGSTLNASKEGRAVITATIEDGLAPGIPYTLDFPITVARAQLQVLDVYVAPFLPTLGTIEGIDMTEPTYNFLGTYPIGSRITLKAVPKPGCRFLGWSIGYNNFTDYEGLCSNAPELIVSAAAEWSFTLQENMLGMNGAVFLNAIFQLIPSTNLVVAVTPSEGGIFSLDAWYDNGEQEDWQEDLQDYITGSGYYEAGTKLRLRAEAAEGYVFDRWVIIDGNQSRDQTGSTLEWIKSGQSTRIIAKFLSENTPDPVYPEDDNWDQVSEILSYSGQVAQTEDGISVVLQHNVTLTTPVHLIDRNISLDLNGYSLTIDTRKLQPPEYSEAAALWAENSRVAFAGGSFRVISSGTGVLADHSDVHVSSAEGRDTYYRGVFAQSGSEVRVDDGVTGAYGVSADGSEVIIEGAVTAVYEGVRANDGASVITGTIMVNTGGYGVLASNAEVTVTGGIYVSGEYSIGIYSMSGSKVVVEGSVHASDYGIYANGAGSEITVNGNIYASGENSTGVRAYNSASGSEGGGPESGTGSSAILITVNGSISALGTGVEAGGPAELTVVGNVSATGASADSRGVYVDRGAAVTVDGQIDAADYISDMWDIHWTQSDFDWVDEDGYAVYDCSEGSIVKVGNQVIVTQDKWEAATEEEFLTALAAAPAGRTSVITLMGDFTVSQPVTVDGKNIIFALNGHDLTIDTSEIPDSAALSVINGSVDLSGDGRMYVTGDRIGVYADAASVSVHHAAGGAYGVYGLNGGTISVNGDIRADGTGIYASGGASAAVTGIVYGTRGAEISNEAAVTANRIIADEFIFQDRRIRNVGESDLTESPDALGNAIYTGSDGSRVKVVDESTAEIAIGDRIYATVGQALDTVAGDTPATLRLIRNVTLYTPLTLTDKNLIFDLDGHDFTFDEKDQRSREPALSVTGGTVDFVNAGSAGNLRVLGFALGLSAKAGAQVRAGGISMTEKLSDYFKDNIVVKADGMGTSVVLEGDVTFTGMDPGTDAIGVFAYHEAGISVTGDISVIGKETINVMNYATIRKGTGVRAWAGGQVSVTGTVKGSDVGVVVAYGNEPSYYDKVSKVTVEGDVMGGHVGLTGAGEVMIIGDVRGNACAINGGINGGGVITVTGDAVNGKDAAPGLYPEISGGGYCVTMGDYGSGSGSLSIGGDVRCTNNSSTGVHSSIPFFGALEETIMINVAGSIIGDFSTGIDVADYGNDVPSIIVTIHGDVTARDMAVRVRSYGIDYYGATFGSTVRINGNVNVMAEDGVGVGIYVFERFSVTGPFGRGLVIIEGELIVNQDRYIAFVYEKDDSGGLTYEMRKMYSAQSVDHEGYWSYTDTRWGSENVARIRNGVLLTVADQSVNVAGGTGTADDPFTAAVTVTGSKDSLRGSDLLIAPDRQTVRIYGDSTYDTPMELFPLNPGENIVYIEGGAGYHYRLSVTREGTSMSAVLMGIAVSAPPAKMDYIVGENLDLAGMIVTAAYSDSTTKPVTGYTADPAGGAVLTGIGSQNITIRYAEDGITKTTNLSVTVNPAPVVLTSIAVTELPAKTDYVTGETLNLTGMVVTAAYSNGNVADVSASVSTYPEDGAELNTDGTQTVTVSYTEDGITKTASFPITVNAALPTVTAVTVAPSVIEVLKGSTQLFTAIVSGTNDPPQDVTWSVSGNSSAVTAISASGLLTVAADETAATLTITATSVYDTSKSGSATVTVTEAPPSPVYGISLEPSDYLFPAVTEGYDTQAAKTVTVSNTGNQPTGAMTIGITAGDTAAFTISAADMADIAIGDTNTFTVHPAAGLSQGTYNATVTISGGNGISASLTVRFTVNPAPVLLDSILVTALPAKTDYVIGETLDLTGMEVKALYSDAHVTDVTSSSTASPAQGAALTATGMQTVTVSYTEGGITKTADFSVTVNPAPVVLESIAVDTLPMKTSYFAGETLDLTGIVVKALYSNGTIIDVSPQISTDPVDGAVLSTLGSQPVTVSYTEDTITKTASFPVIVNAALPTVTGVTVNPSVIEVQKGSTQLFTAIVSGTNDPPQDVTWGVSGNSSAGTGILASGLLTVSADETAAVLTITAVSVYDTSKSGAAAVTVTTAPPVPVYGISVGADHTFPAAAEGYGAQTDFTVTVTNTGNQPTGALTVDITGDDPTAFDLSVSGTASIASIGVGAKDSFAIVPVPGLSEGTYTATVTVRGDHGITGSLTVRFTVTPAPVVLEGIVIASLPDKTEYIVSEFLDLTGMVITAVYSNGDMADVTAAVTTAPVSGTVLTSIGTRPVLVIYTEGTISKTAEFPVRVSNPPSISDPDPEEPDGTESPSSGSDSPSSGSDSPPAGSGSPPADSDSPPADPARPPAGSSSPPAGSDSPPAGPTLTASPGIPEFQNGGTQQYIAETNGTGNGTGSPSQNNGTTDNTDIDANTTDNTDIDANTTPMDSGERSGESELPVKEWAVVNLLFLLIGIAFAIISLIRYARKKIAAGVISVLGAAAAVVTFSLTEDLSLPMGITNSHTIWMAGIVVIEVIATLAAARLIGRDGSETEAIEENN